MFTLVTPWALFTQCDKCVIVHSKSMKVFIMLHKCFRKKRQKNQVKYYAYYYTTTYNILYMENTVLCNMQSIQFQFITVQEKVPKSSLGLFAPPGGRYFCQPNVRAA